MKDRGFTLLELIVVMVLVALSVSLAGPKISSFLESDQLKVTVRKLEGLISQSSLLAQRRQASYLLKYIEGERRFVVEPELNAGEQASFNSELHLADSVAVEDLWTFYGGTRSSEEFVIRFNKNGYVEPTVIHLREEGGQEFSLVLSPFLGKIQIVDSYVVPNKETFL